MIKRTPWTSRHITYLIWINGSLLFVMSQLPKTSRMFISWYIYCTGLCFFTLFVSFPSRLIILMTLFSHTRLLQTITISDSKICPEGVTNNESWLQWTLVFFFSLVLGLKPIKVWGNWCLSSHQATRDDQRQSFHTM